MAGPNRNALPAAPAPDLGIGGPFAPPEPLLTLPPSGIPSKKAATQANQAKLKARALKAKADAAAQKAKDAMIVAQRQDANVKRALKDRVSATNGLTPTSAPFGPVQHGAGKGSGLVEADLTTNSRLAAARAERLLNGGLLQPQAPHTHGDTRTSESEVEKEGLQSLRDSTSYTFADKPWHQLPYKYRAPAVHLSPEDDQQILASGSKFNTGQNTGVTVDPTKPGFFANQLGEGYFGQGTSPGHVLRQLEPSTIQGGIEQALSSLKEGPGAIPADVVMQPDWIAEALHAAGQKIDPAAYGATYGTKSHPTITLKDFLTDEQKYGKYNLGTKARKALTALMVQGGWNAKDAPNLTDAELAARAYNPFHKSLGGILRNAAGGLGLFTSLPAFGQEVIESGINDVRQRSLEPSWRVAQEFGQNWADHLPVLADRPYDQVAYNDPIGAAAAILPPAKFLSGRLGKAAGLKPFRDVELPHAARAAAHAEARGEPMPDGFSATRRVSASVHPIYRAGQAIHDRILAQSKSPDEIKAQPPVPEGLRNVPSDIARSVSNPIARLGHHLEGRIAKQDRKDERLRATLEMGHESHVALVRYAAALRALPWVGRHLSLDDRQGKGEAQRSVIFHGLIGKTSEQIANYFHSEADNSETLAGTWEERASNERELAAQEEARGTAQGVFRAAEHTAQARHWEEEAKSAREDAVRQRELGDWSRANPHDHANPKKGEDELLAAALRVSHHQDTLLEKAGKQGRKGTLYGRLQHNLAITFAQEGPGTALGGEHGTALGREAARIMHPEHGLRALHNAARDKLFGLPVGTEASGEGHPHAADMRTASAEHQLGRYHRLSMLSRVADGIQRRRAQRIIDRQLRYNGETALATAQSHAQAWGIDPAKLSRLQARVADVLGRVVQSGEPRAVNAELRAGELRSSEKAGHSARIAKRLAVANHDLQVMKDRGRPTNEITRQQALIDDLKHQYEEGFQASAKVLQGESEAEKTRLAAGLRTVPERDIQHIIRTVFNHDEMQRLGPELLHDVALEEIDNASHLDATHEQLRQRLDEAGQKFTDETQLDPADAVDYQVKSQHYLQRLRVYEQLLNDEGITTGHMRLVHPEEAAGLQPSKVSLNTQFPRAKFGRDMHIYLAKDLEGNTAKAIEGKLYEHLAELPWVIDDAFDGQAPPPGFIAVPWGDWKNLTAPSRDNEAARKLFSSWSRDGRPEPVEGKQVFISRILRDQLVEQDHLTSGRGAGTVSRLLKANNFYRKWMLYTLPRTLVNNAVGNPIIAFIMGSRVRDLREAVWTLNNHPERIMSTLRGRGPLANALGEGALPLNSWRAMMRHFNTFHEDNGNLMVYLMHARKAFKEDNNLKWFNRVAKTDELWGEFLEKAARGENPDAFEWGRKSAQAFGDMHDHWKSDPALASTFLFHRWVAHTIYLTLWSLPIHYPGRFLFLTQAAELGDQYQKEHGIWPEWAKGLLAIPGLVENQHLPAGMQKILWAVSTQGVNPFSTPAQTIDFGTTAQPKSGGQAMFAANLSPIFRVPGEILSGHRLDTLQPFKDHLGNEIGYGLNWREAVNNLIANTPIANSIWSRSGMSDDSIQIPWLGQSWPRYSSVSKYDPNYSPPNAFQGPAWRTALIDILGGVGLPVRPIDSEGVRGQMVADAGMRYQQRQAATRQSHSDEATVRALLKMTSQQRKDWFKLHDPVGYARGDWRRYDPKNQAGP